MEDNFSSPPPPPLLETIDTSYDINFRVKQIWENAKEPTQSQQDKNAAYIAKMKAKQKEITSETTANVDNGNQKIELFDDTFIAKMRAKQKGNKVPETTTPNADLMIVDLKEKTDSLDMDTNCFAKCISIFKYRHLVTVWLPLIDIVTDILTIINYMNSDLTEVQVFGIVLCVIIYLSSRLQIIITICSIFNGEDFGLIDDGTIWNVFAMYIPFIAPASRWGILTWIVPESWSNILMRIAVSWCSILMSIPCSIFIEILLLTSVIIYPFRYLYSACNTVYKMVSYTLYNNTYKGKVEDPWNEYKVGDCNGYYTYWELSDFGWIQFGNDWEAITESLPQLVIQIYVYCNYTQSVTLQLFIFSTAVSGLNILRIILKVCIKGGTSFYYDQNNQDTLMNGHLYVREEAPDFGCCGCGDVEINCGYRYWKSKLNCCPKKANNSLQTELFSDFVMR